MGTKLVRTLIVIAILCITNGYGDPERSFWGEPYNVNAFQRSGNIKPTFDTKLEENVIAYVGHFVTFPVTFSGDPIPKTQWEKVGDAGWRIDGGRIRLQSEEENSSILKIQNLTKGDEGQYKCTLTNKFGTENSGCYLTVRDIVEPTFIEEPKDFILYDDDQEVITFTANFSGDPIPSVTWKKVGDADWKIEDDRMEVTSEIKDSHGTSTLVIIILDESDFGEYECTLSNEFGKTVSSTVKASYIDVCENVTCGNNSYCAVTEEKKYECRCRNTYIGENCDIDICKGVTCGNRSFCTVNEKRNGSVCSCSSPYTGKDCEIDVCEKKPCGKWGHCTINRKENKYQCRCLSTFTGKDCKTDVCKGKPCGIGGFCTINRNRNNYECTCYSNYVGKNCETDVCKGKPCGKQGFCTLDSEKNKYECICYSTYIGKNCETDVCEGVTCGKNSMCFINRTTNVADCICISTYTGKDCQIDVCEGVKCGNRSYCEINRKENRHECRCNYPYEGKNCEFASCKLYICNNGGTCKLNKDKSDYECLCPEHYEGNTCFIDIREPNFIRKPEDVTVKEGDPVRITTTFRGDPTPTVIWGQVSNADWKIDGKRIQVQSETEGSSTLVFKKVTRSDGRLYRCKLTNSKGKTVTAWFILSVKSHDIPVAGIIGGVVGSGLLLTIIVAALIIWRKKNQSGPGS